MIDEIKKENIIQLKLCNGEEILANQIQKDDSCFVINYALTIIPMEGDEYEDYESKTYYLLRPFVSYTDDLEKIVSVNPYSVIAINSPPDNIINHFLKSLQQIQDILKGEDTSESEKKERGKIVLLRPNPSTKETD